VPQSPHDLGWPVQVGASAPEVLLAANVENFLVKRFELQWGQAVPSQLDEGTSISLSWPHFSQWNS